MNHFGFQRSSSARSFATPAASIFAHWPGVKRIERKTSCLSGGVGGLPRAGFGASMWQIVVPQQIACNLALLCHNKCNRSPKYAMQDQPLIRPVTELATMFGCTPEQVRAQFLRNAADYDKLAAKAEAKGAKVRGYTAAQLRDMAETARKRAGA